MREACSKMIPSVPARISYSYKIGWLIQRLPARFFKVKFYKIVCQILRAVNIENLDIEKMIKRNEEKYQIIIILMYFLTYSAIPPIFD